VDKTTLTDVLSGKHLNMEERARRGAWPHPPIRFSELVQHVANQLLAERWFPTAWRERAPGDPVADRTVIERQAPDRFVVRFERSGPAMNLAEAGAKVFGTGAEEAAAFYLSSEFHLPGDLDGWKVIA